MEQYEIQCEALINKCKQEAKQLAELAATRNKVHWTQSSFVSFCISVEEILSYGVRKRYAPTKQLCSSAKILADLSRSFPVAAATFDKCYGVKSRSSSPEDYVHLVTSSSTERRILWVRVAIIESSLITIVNEIIKNAGKYYTEKSVIFHPVYGELFGYLLDGPCSIRVSRLKIADTALTSPTPTEIVKRHNKVLSASISKIQQDGVSQTGTEEAWDHVKSLYQTTTATCLFGKNNIHVRPAGFSESLAGYLTLQRVVDNLQLKWIPNSLLKSSSNAPGSLWDHVLSLDVGTQVAHLHCHRSTDSAGLILIGYDGIAYPRLVFSHQPSLFQFLECLENNLLPRGSLEPPLWYIKTQTTKAKKSAWRPLSAPLPASSEWGVGEVEEWWEGVDVWNQVFRLRFSSGATVRPDSTNATNTREIGNKRVTRGQAPHLPLNLHTLRGQFSKSVGSSSSSSSAASSTVSSNVSSVSSSPCPSPTEEDRRSPFGISIDKPTSLARKDWEKFQLKVSKQLIARYFYSWLSYCRHMKKVHDMVAHMVDANVSLDWLNPVNYKDGVVEELWANFLANRNAENWTTFLKAVYNKGIRHSLRPEVWPWLLRLYPTNSTDEETESIRAGESESYRSLLEDWRKVEVVHLKLLAIAEKKRQERMRREFAAHISDVRVGGFRKEEVEVDGVNGRGGGGGGGGGQLGTCDGETTPVLDKEEEEEEEEEEESDREDCVSEQTPLIGSPQTTPFVSHSSQTTPIIHRSQNPSPERTTTNDHNSSSQSPPSHPPHPTTTTTLSSQDYIIAPQNDITLKARSSSVDSGHSSNCNLGNSIGSSHGNSFGHSSHGDEHTDDSLVEWNGTTNGGMGLGPEEQVNGLVQGTIDEEREEEEEDNLELDEKGRLFADELLKIDKDIPRCDRDYWFFKEPGNLTKLRNIVSTYVWTHLEDGYSQGMCDLLAPLLVVLEDEALTYACYLRLMEKAILLFPPHTEMNTRLSNLKALLQVLEPDFFQYLSDKPLGDGLFYCYRWFLVSYKREFEYSQVFRLWETWWAARECCSAHFLEFCGLAIMTQFKPAIMDAHMDSSDILNLFTDLADSKAINCSSTISLAQSIIRDLVCALTRRE